jgi:hypothetical protein
LIAFAAELHLVRRTMPSFVEIDVSAVETSRELHELLSAKLCFPSHYGHNWDAFDECISDPGLELPDRVCVKGMDALVATLPSDAALLRDCASRPDAHTAFVWQP